MNEVHYVIHRLWLELRFKVGMFLSTKGEQILSTYIIAARELEKAHVK